MANKKQQTPPTHGHVLTQTLEEVMHQSMLPYAEYVIMERALPRVEDGLKPVQRRILFAMNDLGLTPDKPHRKSATVVGEVLGKYHPHGDTAVYDAMVRMAQDFNMSATLVDGHGNFGSVDGDTAAAMRYTEARMTPLALEMLRDIEKDTVPFKLNYDDRLQEPVILPSRFPNLLVNGASGIAVGLATNIPPHNLGEVINGMVAYYKKPSITLEEMMTYIPGPDFPTGGFCTDGEELLKAYQTGRGRLLLRAKTQIEYDKNGKSRIVITELPYQVNKAALLEKILRISEEKKGVLTSISDIRDESDREGMRAVIELRKDADPEKILQILFKYSDLQVTFGVNIIAIADGRPQQMGLLDICRYYGEYQKRVVTARTQYDLEEAERREHILQGLIIAVEHIDEVIRIIRASKSAKEARENLMKRFDMTGIQAQAVLDMRLRRLTALELDELRSEYAQVTALIAELRSILASEKKLVSVIIKEMQQIAKQYAVPRRTELKPFDSVATVQIEQEKTPEPCDVLLTHKGYLKRIGLKANGRAQSSAEEGEEPLFSLRCMTTDRIRFFTDRGNVFAVQAEDIPECKRKDRGTNAAGLLAGLEHGEQVVSMLVLDEKETADVLFFTRHGMVKRTKAEEYQARRGKLAACGLKDGDAVLSVALQAGLADILLVSRGGMAIRFAADTVPAQGRTAAGVKGIILEKDDEVILGRQLPETGELMLVTERGYAKRTPLSEFEPQNRNGKGVRILPFAKDGSNGEQLVAALLCTLQDTFLFVQFHGTQTPVPALEVPMETRQGKGTPVVLALFDDVVTEVKRMLRT